MGRLPKAENTQLTLENSQTAKGGTVLGRTDDVVWTTETNMLLMGDPLSFPVENLSRRLGEDRQGIRIDLAGF